MTGRKAEIRLGLVGCGRLAERGYLPAFRRTEGVRLAGVADPVQERCRDLAPNVPAHRSGEELVSAGGVDGLVIATPAASHRANAAAAAAAGVPALVEKPPAAHSRDAGAMASLHPAPWIGFNRRFEPGIQRLRLAVHGDSDIEVEIVVHHPGGSWGSYVVRDDALLAHGPHHLDLARWLTGAEIEEVRAGLLNEEFASLELKLGSGRARISTGTSSRARDEVTVRAGGRTLRYRGHGTMRRTWRRLRRPGMAGDLVHLLERQLEEFATVVRGGVPAVLATAVDGLAVMRAIEAARESARAAGAWRVVAAPPRDG